MTFLFGKSKSNHRQRERESERKRISPTNSVFYFRMYKCHTPLPEPYRLAKYLLWKITQLLTFFVLSWCACVRGTGLCKRYNQLHEALKLISYARLFNCIALLLLVLNLLCLHVHAQSLIVACRDLLLMQPNRFKFITINPVCLNKKAIKFPNYGLCIHENFKLLVSYFERLLSPL